VKLSIKSFVITQMLASALTSAICLILLIPHLHKFSFKSVGLGGFYERIKSSFPYALLSLLMAFYLKMDGVMLERLLPDGALQSGIYAASFRLYDASVAVVLLLGAVLMPAFSHQIAKGESIDFTLKSAMTFAFVLYSICAVVCFYYADNFMEVLYRENHQESALILKILMIGSIISSLSYILGALLTAGGNLTELNLSAFTGALVNMGLNFLLIPIFKASGSALATLFTQVCLLAIQWTLVSKYFKIKTNYKFIFKSVLFLTIAFGIGYAIKQFIPITWFFQLLVLGATLVGLTFAMGILSFKTLLEFKKRGA
jgi:O-antigen/teichoic acid export membrane protein